MLIPKTPSFYAHVLNALLMYGFNPLHAIMSS